MANVNEREAIRGFSDEIVALQQPIRVLDAVAWTDEIAADFLARSATTQPRVEADYYVTKRPLRFDPVDLKTGLRGLADRIS